MSTPNDFLHALKTRGHFELIEQDVSATRARFVGRVLEPHGVQNKAWPLLARQLLIVADKQAPWQVDICRHYFIRYLPSGPQMFYAWRLIFQAPDLAVQWPHIVETVMNAPAPSRSEVMEVPLQGGAARNTMKNGKGVAASGVR